MTPSNIPSVETSTDIQFAKAGALFVNERRTLRDVTVVRRGDHILAWRPSRPDQILADFVVVENVTDENSSPPISNIPKHIDAFDAYDANDPTVIVRIATTQGCGCGGRPPYTAAPGYSGLLDVNGKSL